MKKAALFAVVLATFALLGGCYVTGRAMVPTVHAQVVAPPPPTVVGTVQVNGPPPPTIVGTVTPPRPVYIGGATVLASTCSPNAPEVLNGIDDNCNGLIDEGFVGTGNLQITLGWNTPADLDLYVDDPTGTTISYSNTQSPSGGFLDRDARGACTDSQTGENVFWSGTPPAGHYAIRVNYYSPCESAGPTTFVLSVSYAGQIVGAYQFTISPEETVEVASFDL
jgi:hypothetical protein